MGIAALLSGHVGKYASQTVVERYQPKKVPMTTDTDVSNLGSLRELRIGKCVGPWNSG